MGNLKTDPATGRSRGFAFVVFKTVDGLKDAVATEEHAVKGKKVAVKKAQAKQGKIYVGKLKAELSDDDIKSHFAQFGQIAQVEQPFDKTKNERKNYDPDSENSESQTGFNSWLRCYYVEGMKNLRDGNGRTIWFSGDPGPMAPKNAKTVRRKGEGSGIPKSEANNKDEPEEKKIKQESKYEVNDVKDVRKSKPKVKVEAEDKFEEKKVIL